MSQQDTGLYKSFAVVLGALVLFTLFIIVIANIFSPSTDYSEDPLIANSVKNQIQPVGRSNVKAEAAAVAGQATEASDATAASQSAVDSTEKAAEGAADGDNAEVATTEKAEATDDSASASDSSAVAKADTASQVTNSTSSADPVRPDPNVSIPVKVKAVVATNCAGCHENGVLGAQRNDDGSAWQALADKGLDTLVASVISGKGNMPARAETSLDDAELKLAVQHMINKNLAGSEGQQTGAAATEETAATPVVAAKAEQKSELANDETTSAETVIPDNVKAAVDTLCAACHISGVGNAPKYGDKEAWATRMANGIDAVTASAIAGKGAMPPRGGSQLTDAEMKLAIEYMVSK